MNTGTPAALSEFSSLMIKHQVKSIRNSLCRSYESKIHADTQISNKRGRKNVKVNSVKFL